MNKKIIEIRSQVEGWFRLDAYKVDDNGKRHSERELAPWFRNLILNQGLDRMAQNANWMGSCQVGSGNAAPANTDTQLQTFVAGKTNTLQQGIYPIRGAVSAPDYYAHVTNLYVFDVGSAAGNLSEVGVGWASTGATLYSRALILDIGGNPTTITVLPDEVLQVTYQWRIYPPLADVVGTVNLSGADYDYVIRACMAGTYSNMTSSSDPGWGGISTVTGSGTQVGSSVSARNTYPSANGIAAITARPTTADQGNADSFSSSAYSVGNYYLDSTLLCGISKWNGVPGGIKTIVYSHQHGSYQIEFEPALSKDNTKSLSLVFRQSWARRTI